MAAAIKDLRRQSHEAGANHFVTALLSHSEATFPKIKYYTRQEAILAFNTGGSPGQRELEEWRKAVLGRNNLIIAISGSLDKEGAREFVDLEFADLPNILEPRSDGVDNGVDTTAATYRRRIIKLERDISHMETHIFVTLFGSITSSEAAVAEMILWNFTVGQKSPLKVFLANTFGPMGREFGMMMQEIPVSPRHTVMSVRVLTPGLASSYDADALVKTYDDYLTRGIDETELLDIRRPFPLNKDTHIITYRAEAMFMRQVTGWTGRSVRLPTDYAGVNSEEINSAMRGGKMGHISIVIVAPKQVIIRADCSIVSPLEVIDKCQ